jgi:hypothetical protein
MDACHGFKLRPHDLKYFGQVRGSGDRDFTLRGLARRTGHK